MITTQTGPGGKTRFRIDNLFENRKRGYQVLNIVVLKASRKEWIRRLSFPFVEHRDCSVVRIVSAILLRHLRDLHEQRGTQNRDC